MTMNELLILYLYIYQLQGCNIMAVINNHELEPNSYGGIEVYFENFEPEIQDMMSVRTSYEVKIAKINLLNNISDDTSIKTIENL